MNVPAIIAITMAGAWVVTALSILWSDKFKKLAIFISFASFTVAVVLTIAVMFMCTVVMPDTT